jgi:processive 1,2-diacylglycerol beta-glucosyltransferase
MNDANEGRTGMHRVKNVLFLYISFSSGHMRAAEAVMNALRRMSSRVAMRGVDSFHYAFPAAAQWVARAYLEVLKRAPRVWEFLYDNPSVAEATRAPRRLFDALNADKIRRLLKRHHPRALVCTQAVPAAVLSALKERGKLRIPVIAVVTDFGVHRYWVSRHIDLYLVATEEIKRQLVQAGVRESRVRVTGIPVDPSFLSCGDKRARKRELGLNADRPVVLVSGGSRGLGPMEDTVACLRRELPEVQVLAVCGYNRSARRRLEERVGGDPSVRIFDYVSDMSRLMDACDLLISKPGGLTCAESMAKGLPLLMIRPLPGQEDRNARYMLAHGAAEKADSLDELIRHARTLLNEERRDELRRRALALAKPHAAFDAAESILQLIGEPVPGRTAKHTPAPAAFSVPFSRTEPASAGISRAPVPA